MRYKRFCDIELSLLGMGVMRLPEKEDASGKSIDREKGQAVIDYAISHGINYFDTAYTYHDSETFLGEALSKYPRESYYLADKFNLSANPDYKAQFEEQLVRLKTDYIDFYLLHSIFDFNADEYLKKECIEYFFEQKRLGKIKYFGFSSHGSPDVLRKVASVHKWDFAQIQLNYYDWECNTAKGLYEILSERNIPVMVMEPLLGGKLAALNPEASAVLKKADSYTSIASWGLRWVAGLSNVHIVLSGMSSIEQIIDNVTTFDEYKPLSEDENKALIKACKIYQQSVSIVCTGCRYCCDGCPKGLDIPRLLNIYNDCKVGGSWRIKALDSFAEDKKPSACIGCNACNEHCPQGFDIPAYMQEMAELTGGRP